MSKEHVLKKNDGERVGCCVECGATLSKEDEINGFKGIFECSECSECGHPNGGVTND